MPDLLNELVSISAENPHGTVLLTQPAGALGIVIITQGSSRWMSLHMDDITHYMHTAGIGTLQLEVQADSADTRTQTDTDITALTERLISVTQWIQSQPPFKELAIAYFCTGTGTAAAIQAAAALTQNIKAIVSLGGRPDRADTEDLNRLTSPILLLVGSQDDTTLTMNQEAYSQMHSVKHISIIPGANHVFEGPGCLQGALRLVTEWFLQYMTR